MNIMVLHGPNLHLLGVREPNIYGSQTLEEINVLIQKKAEALNVEVEIMQANDEGALVERIGRAKGTCDGILLNAAAYTHTSIAIRDAVSAVGVPCVEVHLSNTAAREDFRRISYVSGVSVGQVAGFGADSYVLALEGLVNYIRKRFNGI